MKPRTAAISSSEARSEICSVRPSAARQAIELRHDFALVHRHRHFAHFPESLGSGNLMVVTGFLQAAQSRHYQNRLAVLQGRQDRSHAASRTKSVFQSKFKSLIVLRGHKRCIVALAHKILRTIFFMIKRREHYRDSATDYEALPVQRNAPRWIKALIRHRVNPLTFTGQALGHLGIRLFHVNLTAADLPMGLPLSISRSSGTRSIT